MSHSLTLKASYSLLIVDDHALFRDGLNALLAKFSQFTVVGEAQNGLIAVQLALQLNPDIVIMDISMRDGNGLDAAKKIKDRLPSMKILILSMHTDRDLVQTALASGVDGYVLKESASNELIDALNTLILGKPYVSTELHESLVAIAHNEKSSEHRLSSLSQREREIFHLLAEGFTHNEIALKLCLSVKSVETYKSRLMKKLQIKDMVSLTKLAIKTGLVSTI